MAAEASLLAAGGAVVLGGSGRAGGRGAVSRVDSVPTGMTRTWLAPQYWANRLADWRLTDGRIEA